MNKATFALIVALAAIVIAGLAIVGIRFSSNSNIFGSTSCANITCLSGGLRLVTDAGGDFEADVASIFSGTVSLTSTFKLGASGTAQSNQVITTCSMIANNASAGTTSQYAYCTGVTGVTSSDLVTASFASSTTNRTDQWVILGAKASTTAAAIDFSILNLTGTVAAATMSSVSVLGSTTVIRAAH